MKGVQGTREEKIRNFQVSIKNATRKAAKTKSNANSAKFFFLFIGCYKWLFRMNFNAHFRPALDPINYSSSELRNFLRKLKQPISANEQIALWNKNV
jgi:hypothetical protein